MDKYTVKMFPQAYRDLDHIYELALLNDNYGDNALKLVEKLEDAIISLEEQPYRGAERKYGFYAYKGYRQLFISGYIIIYTLSDEVRPSRRDMNYGMPFGYEILDSENIVAVLTIKYSGSEF